MNTSKDSEAPALGMILFSNVIMTCRDYVIMLHLASEYCTELCDFYVPGLQSVRGRWVGRHEYLSITRIMVCPLSIKFTQSAKSERKQRNLILNSHFIFNYLFTVL